METVNNEYYSFQVNLQGMISLLSEHLYSNPGTFIRELLQNAVDAIAAFRQLDEHLIGDIRITLPDAGPAGNPFVFQDNGIGLKENEIHEFLSVIGESSKRKSAEDARTFIGRFGIGLLSCFVVSDEICIETRSAFDATGFRWTAFNDGRYRIETLQETMPVGTKVCLTPKKSHAHLFRPENFIPQIKFYGDALPEKITIRTGKEEKVLNEQPPVWLHPDTSKEALLQMGKELFQTSFIDAVRLRTEAGECEGVLYILPYKTQFSARQHHRIYLKRMLLSEADNGLLPSWAFFVKMVVNSNTLSATASREFFMQNDLLRAARKEIGKALKSYLKNIRNIDFEIYQKIIQIHFLHLKAIAAEDTEFLSLILDDLPFETNKGFRTFKDIREHFPVIYYCADYEEFRQVQRIAEYQGALVVNVAYTFEEDLIKKIKGMQPELNIREMSSSKLLETFTDISEDEKKAYRAVLKKLEQYTKPFNCVMQLKYFAPADTPAIFTRGDEDFTSATIKKIKANDNPFAGALGSIQQRAEAVNTFCLNMNNGLVKNLLTIDDDYMLQAITEVLYVQALLMGKYPVSEKQLLLFNNALHSLLVMGMKNFIQI
ncbi:HSP90 family protein [Niabella ginsenosidivorans]|uniref:HSP90 family protein n=1 Tax=Niabella ginsenosidivorans TaxID=1176587 RepID=A0A1A9I402_9BACT|nr:HSP90 family protein [Niabella ginsenosidivorans]ANH82407.1 HSP90 family protein [Niabella ginsenosidivorans]